MVDQKEKKIIKEGIIGFFDILGYGSLMENNEPEEIYRKIYPIIEGLLENKSIKELKVVKKSKNKFTDVKKSFKEYIDEVKFDVFSDTILITLNTSKFEEDEQGFCWSIFLPICSILQKNMFKMGLPLRGVINYGRYISRIWAKKRCQRKSTLCISIAGCKVRIPLT